MSELNPKSGVRLQLTSREPTLESVSEHDRRMNRTPEASSLDTVELWHITLNPGSTRMCATDKASWLLKYLRRVRELRSGRRATNLVEVTVEFHLAIRGQSTHISPRPTIALGCTTNEQNLCLFLCDITGGLDHPRSAWNLKCSYEHLLGAGE